MTSGATKRLHTFAAVVALGGGLALTACSSDSSDGPGDTAAVAAGECQLGATVDEPATKDGVPECADQPGAKVRTYDCFPEPGGPQQGSWYMVENSNGTVMYGKPGGVWKQAESFGKPETDLVQSIGC